MKYRLRLWQYDFQGGRPGKKPTHELLTEDPLEVDVFLRKYDVDDDETSTAVRLTLEASHAEVYDLLRREIERDKVKP